jgi:hypothetical protein
MGFGGPVWHCSVSRGDRTSQRLEALSVLAGVGDPVAGEWWEVGELATHLRRRLTDAEATSIGPVVDVRGTEEATKRMKAIWSYLPERGREFAEREAAGR